MTVDQLAEIVRGIDSDQFDAAERLAIVVSLFGQLLDIVQDINRSLGGLQEVARVDGELLSQTYKLVVNHDATINQLHRALHRSTDPQLPGGRP